MSRNDIPVEGPFSATLSGMPNEHHHVLSAKQLESQHKRRQLTSIFVMALWRRKVRTRDSTGIKVAAVGVTERVSGCGS